MVAIILSIFRRPYENLNAAFLRLVDHKAALWAVGVAAAFLYVWGYLTKPAYYTHYVGGVTGDNYRYMIIGARVHFPLMVGHIYFPLIPQLLFKALLSFGYYLPNDPDLFAKMVGVYSLPSRLFTVVGFWACFRLLRAQKLTALESGLGTLFLATTFGYWFWAIQANALGFLIPFLLLTFLITVKAIQTGRARYALCAGLMSGLCFYVHIGSAFTLVGLALIVGFAFWKRYRSGDLQGRIQLDNYLIVAFLLAHLFFFYIMPLRYDTRTVSGAFEVLSDPGVLGRFSFKNFPVLFLKDGLSTNLSLLLGLLQVEGKPFWERVVNWGQLTLFVFIVISILRSKNFRAPSWKSHIPFWVVLAVFMTCMVGFSLRKTWFQYYSILTPASMLLFTFLLFSRRAANGVGGNHLALSLLLILNVAGNGFGAHGVHRGLSPESDPTYRALVLADKLAAGRQTLFVAPMTAEIYSFDGIVSYYSLENLGPYRKILWEYRKDFTERRKMKNLAEGRSLILIHPSWAADYLQNPLAGYRSKLIETGSPDYPTLVAMERKTK